MATTPPSVGNIPSLDALSSDKEQMIHQLHGACMSDEHLTVQSLLEQGVDANAIDENRMTALHLACGFASPKVVQVLLSHCGTHETKFADGMSISIFCAVPTEMWLTNDR